MTEIKLEFSAKDLRDKLDKVKAENRIDSCLRFCAPAEGFCQGVVESTANGWRKMRLNATEASVVSTTFLAKKMHTSKSKDTDSLKKYLCEKTDHRGVPREIAIFIGDKTDKNKKKHK